MKHPATHARPCDCGECSGLISLCEQCASEYPDAAKAAGEGPAVECECGCHVWNDACDAITQKETK